MTAPDTLNLQRTTNPQNPMPFGPGKYDREATDLLQKIHAQAVVVMVIDGDKGSGFSVCLDQHGLWRDTEALPCILRSVAEHMEADFRKLKKQ